ncbi:hypothetical protein Z959_08430 [Clostridium novyi B str. ATCC 27606]|uniref:Uncharacterized protein n=1 Tax=Clostridium novyi B str. ATCC 27606 TaxID=1443123 RepID=A0AA40IUG0_CLONO|nr:hypothetical protein [Clostridium novyi]KEI16851.1 hypothetical protein Z959_08430 [Clostridium novyi B str. ATCC 27606]
MEWRDKLNDYLEGKLKLFEQDYVHGTPCTLKRNKKRIKAKIDFENKIIYDLKGNILRRCN